MGKLYIHLGPPKTASTSLQQFLQAYDHPKVKFGGVNQPRKPNSNSLSSAILKYCISGGEMDRIIALKEIDIALSNSTYVIVSEEMFLVHNQSISIHALLDRLKILLNNIDTHFILTVRNPVDAIPSYYQEIFKYLPQEMKNSFNKFLLSDYVLPYRYEQFLTELRHRGFNNFVLLDYTKLIQAEYTVGDILQSGEINDRIELGWANKSKKREEAYRVLEDRSGFEKMVKVLAMRTAKIFRGTGIGKPLLQVGAKFRKEDVRLLEVPIKLQKEFNDFYLKHFEAS